MQRSHLPGFLHSHSYTGNALACSAALATLAIFEQDDVLTVNREKAAYMNRRLNALAQLPITGLRNTGMIWAFEVATQQAQFSRRFYEAGLARGLLLRPIGNTVYFMPPYVIDEPEMDWLVEQTAQLITEWA